ncbi:hypothetical protein FQA39_LY01874 [Lamprigera yunnana]|nr:hypothetical protein FQA39_LY01874 [Lamprigera yunnana]
MAEHFIEIFEDDKSFFFVIGLETLVSKKRSAYWVLSIAIEYLRLTISVFGNSSQEKNFGGSKMLTSVFIIIILSSIVLSDAKVTVMVLNKNNFDSAVKTNEYIFVKFFASWCKYSRDLAPEYIRLAKKVYEMQLPITIAEIEASNEDELCKKYSVSGFPTLVLFIRGSPLTYYEGRTVKEMLEWLLRQVESAVIEITTSEELLNTTDNQNVRFFKGSSSQVAKNFTTIADFVFLFLIYVEKNFGGSKMLTSVFIITILSSIVSSDTDTDVKDTVVALNKNNFDSAVKTSEYVFVKFFATWCKYSRDLAPEYIRLAEQVSDMQLPITIAEIEASNEQELCEKYSVFGYPTLVLFRRGAPITYYEGRTVKEIIQWLKSQVRSAVKEITIIDELLKTTNTQNITIVGFFKDTSSQQAKNFATIADHFDKPIFVTTSNEETLKKFNAAFDTTILFDKLGNRQIKFEDELTLQTIKSFIEIESAPPIIELSPQNAKNVFSDKIKNKLLVFRSKKRKNSERVLKLAHDISKHYKNTIFVSINIDETDFLQILSYFDIKPEETPAIGLISGKKNIKKYKMDNELTSDNIKKFLGDFEKGKLKNILLSEKLPENWNHEPVHVLVSSNFDTVTKDTNKDVVVYFYATECDQCTLWESIVVRLGKYYEKQSDIVVSKINVGRNEFYKAHFREVPSIVIYKKHSNKRVVYKGKGNYDDIVQFIDSNRNSVTNGNIKIEL